LDKIKKLYDYQLIDLSLEQEMENLKNTDIRKRLQKIHNYLRKQQSGIKKLEQSLIVKQNDVSDANEQLGQLLTSIESLSAEIKQANDDEIDLVDVNYVKDLVAEQEKILDNLQRQKKKLEMIVESANGADEKLKAVLTNVTKAKKEFADLKTKHDLEIEEAQPKIDAIKKKLTKAEKTMDADLVAKYKKIKSNISPAIADVSNSKCMGCHMDIPSSRLSKIQQGKVLECESCGRILYLKV
jgi:uncharacterized protein